MAKSELRSGDLVLTVVGDRLAAGARWVPAASLKEGGAPAYVPTLGSHLLDALGCDSRAGALAYWDWEVIQESVRECWLSIESVVGPKPELWSNAADRTLADVTTALGEASCSVVVPDEPFERRPWAVPTVVRTCRIPYVPVASVVHVWLCAGGSLGAVLERLGIDGTTDPWDVLRASDPGARDRDAPDGVRGMAEAIRRSMLDGPLPQYSPAAGLVAFADAFDDLPTIAEVDSWASSRGRGRAPVEVAAD